MPDEKVFNSENVEIQCASQLIGHYILLNQLFANKQISELSRIVWVSSGGMYLKKIDLENLLNPSAYDKVEVYANVKRAQITLVEELSKIQKWSRFSIFSMHPGWVNTDGLQKSLPKFYKIFQSRLRKVSEGADTIIWLLLTEKELFNGGFYFDRERVLPYFLDRFNPSVSERKKLMDLLDIYHSKFCTKE